MVTMKLLLIALLSIHLNNQNLLVKGEIFDHLENMLISVLTHEQDIFENEVESLRRYYSETIKNFKCDSNSHSNLTVGNFFGLKHNVGDELQKQLEFLSVLCIKVNEMVLEKDSLMESEVMILKELVAEEVEEYLNEHLSIVINAFIQNEIVDERKLRSFISHLKVLDFGVSINPCDDNYSTYKHVYIQYLRKLEEEILIILHTEFMTGARMYINEQIQIQPIEVHVPNIHELKSNLTTTIGKLEFNTGIEHRVCDLTRLPIRDVDFVELENLHHLIYLPSRYNTGSNTHEQCLCKSVSENKDPSNSTFILSSEPILSDISANKVITGIKFVKKDKIIYLRVEEGILIPEAEIKPRSNSWISAKLLDQEKILTGMKNSITSEIFENKKYISINEASNHIALTNGRCPANQIVVGVKLGFVNIAKGNSRIIGLSVMCCEFNLEKGELNNCNPETAPWTNEGNLYGDRDWKYVDISNKNSPLTPLPDMKNVLDSGNGNLIQFQKSDQSGFSDPLIVPLLDTRIVSLGGQFPLKEIGLYHRGNHRSSGYIGLRTSTFNQTLRVHI